MRGVVTSWVVLLLVCGCASQPALTPQTAPAPAAPATPSGVIANANLTQDRVAGAITTPLHDVNVVQTKIPAILNAAVDAPYVEPVPRDCATIAAAIAPLDVALGADLDAPVDPKNPGLLQKSEVFAGDATVGAIRGAAESFIPMREWVRTLSGAERHDKRVRAAITAGGVRRAYLKGLGLTLGCKPPAAPLSAALKPKPTAAKPDAGATAGGSSNGP